MHGCRNVSKSGIALVEKRAQQARGSRRLGGEVWGGGVPLPSRLGGLGERRELPQWGPGRSPGRQRILSIF